MGGRFVMTLFVLLCFATPAKAAITIEISATVQNTADYTDGKVVSPIQPVQIDYTHDEMIIAF